MTQAELRHGLPASAIEKILGILADYPAIDQVILYGSRAKGNYRPGSDIDLCLQAPTLHLACEFRPKLDSHSDGTWTPIPRQTGQPFRLNLDSPKS